MRVRTKGFARNLLVRLCTQRVRRVRRARLLPRVAAELAKARWFQPTAATRGSLKGKGIPKHLQEHGETMFQKLRFGANGARQVCLGALKRLMSVGLGPPGQTWRCTLRGNSGNTAKTNGKRPVFPVGRGGVL